MARGRGSRPPYARGGMGMPCLVTAWARVALWVISKGGQVYLGSCLADLGLLDGSRGQESKGGGVQTLFQQLPFLAKVLSLSQALLSPGQHKNQPQLEM